MTKKRNTGFSMVEILIALAIFTVLMVPIVSGIISSLKMSTNSKDIQYRNGYAENLMEYVKTVDIDDVQDDAYYMDIGTLAGSFTTTYEPLKKTVSGTEIEYGKYTIKGQTKLGTKDETYSYQIELDNSYYAEKVISDPNYVDPNNLALGIVEDIDYNKVALIDGTVLNYDSVASDAFKSKKLMELKLNDPVAYRQQMENKDSVDLFAGDTASRLITIEVSGDSTNGFMVRSIFDYVDSNASIAADNHIQYVPYSKTFTGELPNIYLMYDACFYNTDYSAHDYIAVDLTNLTLEEGKEVNLFIVQTAETYSSNIVDSNALDSAKIGKTLIHPDTEIKNAGTRDKVKVHLAAAVSKNGSNNEILKSLNIYYNFGDNQFGDGTDKPNQKTKLDNIWYTNDTSKPAVDSTMQDFEDFMNDSLGIASKKQFVALDDGSGIISLGLLNTATAESRGLYEVKVWIQKGNTVDTTLEPVLQGTKGGNET